MQPISVEPELHERVEKAAKEQNTYLMVHLLKQGSHKNKITLKTPIC